MQRFRYENVRVSVVLEEDYEDFGFWTRYLNQIERVAHFMKIAVQYPSRLIDAQRVVSDRHRWRSSSLASFLMLDDKWFQWLLRRLLSSFYQRLAGFIESLLVLVSKLYKLVVGERPNSIDSTFNIDVVW